MNFNTWNIPNNKDKTTISEVELPEWLSQWGCPFVACAKPCTPNLQGDKEKLHVLRSVGPKGCVLFVFFSDCLKLNCKFTDFNSGCFWKIIRDPSSYSAHIHCFPCPHYLPAASLFTTVHECKVLFLNAYLLH